jgi:SAM-dependent MidA family methyltransferase
MLSAHIHDTIAAHQGWIGFDHFMSLALYTPALGYYSCDSTKLGLLPQGQRDAQGKAHGAGSDFATAPEMSPLFAQALAQQLAQALQHTQTDEIWEFGAGTGLLARQLLENLAALGQPVRRYTIVDLSESLKERQRHTLAGHAAMVQWASSLPAQFQGVVVGNEVLDAMPVQLLARHHGAWHVRGVSTHTAQSKKTFAWSDRPTSLRPPVEVSGTHDYLTELHSQGEAFIRTLGAQLTQGAVFLLDYGFPEAEYYHPQRHMGTVMCHRAHRADGDPLQDVGLKDITAHVNFSALALAAQAAGFEHLGYTSQAHFLLNCGIAHAMQTASLQQRTMAHTLIAEHEMGELFKVLGLVKGPAFAAMGFGNGDRSHRL